MAVSGNIYGNLFDQAMSGLVNYAGDSIKMALLTSSYTPNLVTHVHFSDLTNEVTGTGYTAGGIALASKTHTVTTANSYATSWAVSTAYVVGQIVKPATPNGCLYLCEVSGTSAASAPTWPTTQGLTVVESAGPTWTCIGVNISQWSSAAVSWPSSTLTARYAAIYDAQTGVSSTEPLIALVNFGADQSDTNGSFTVTPASTGWFWNAFA